MKYESTRGASPTIGFTDAMLAGLATDGGLYVPKSWAPVPTERSSDYASLAAEIVSLYAGGELSDDEIRRLCNQAYSTFRHGAVVPLVQYDEDAWLLELFHGPTLAFKDVALQLLGQMFDLVLAKKSQRLTIVGATSGDTGSAAIDGVRNCSNIDIVILYPHGRVSDVQRRQMTTVESPNVHTVAIDGTFDDCQDLVKAMFNDAPFRERHNLSAVNSINWVRVMAQVVYYIHACDSLGGQPISFSVPTGNFGNVLAGWIAKQMGAPIDRLIVGSNSNDILTRFFDTQKMTATSVTPTLSPSMDIQVSSNFERLLFEMNNRDGGATAEQLARFRQTGTMAVEPDQYAKWIAPVFAAASVDDAGTLDVMARMHKECNMLIDPHTAVGIGATEKCRREGETVVTLATAHPAKFPDAVRKATGEHPQLPDHLADLFQLPERTVQLPNDLAAVQSFVASVGTSG